MADQKWVTPLQARLTEHGGHFVKLSGKSHPIWEIGKYRITFPGTHSRSADPRLPGIVAREVETAIVKHLADLEMLGQSMVCACHRPGDPVVVPLSSHRSEVERITGMPVLKQGETGLLKAAGKLEEARESILDGEAAYQEGKREGNALGGDGTMVLDMTVALAEEKASMKKSPLKGRKIDKPSPLKGRKLVGFPCPYCTDGSVVLGKHMTKHTKAQQEEYRKGAAERRKPGKRETGTGTGSLQGGKTRGPYRKKAEESDEPKSEHKVISRGGGIAKDEDIEVLFEQLKRKMLALKYERDEAVKRSVKAEHELDSLRSELEPMREMMARLYPKGK